MSSFCLPDTSLRTLYYTLVYLILCFSMASTRPTNVKRIVIPQKKSSRIFCKKPFDAHTDPILGVIRIFANIEVP